MGAADIDVVAVDQNVVVLDVQMVALDLTLVAVEVQSYNSTTKCSGNRRPSGGTGRSNIH